eukprot:gnl/MRDRNA2_/MRDRNA2_46077_c0_seq1.p1 gnl/MRDRNA2_/MRDRNA2_46077_c0~~gnl/MRDRNA2_/MRDRNA2_46077_c0_seq1.p1  ORF type:complete len:117 (+),score=17.60 gnl/MRDRNA2_/MRDRNA2_46077_c0_seq1:94-444(+)
MTMFSNIEGVFALPDANSNDWKTRARTELMYMFSADSNTLSPKFFHSRGRIYDSTEAAFEGCFDMVAKIDRKDPCIAFARVRSSSHDHSQWLVAWKGQGSSEIRPVAYGKIVRDEV